MTVAERIKVQRMHRRLKQAELADAVDVSIKTIQRWEKSDITPNATKMNLLAHALNTTVAYLSGETNNPERPKAIDTTDTKEKTPEAEAVKVETQTRDRGELVFKLPNGSELRLPDTPENKILLRDIMASVITGHNISNASSVNNLSNN